MPILDLMYIFNIFDIACCDPNALPLLIQMIENKIYSIPKFTDIATYCYLIFMKAVCLLRQKVTIGAEKYLTEVIG